MSEAELFAEVQNLKQWENQMKTNNVKVKKAEPVIDYLAEYLKREEAKQQRSDLK